LLIATGCAAAALAGGAAALAGPIVLAGLAAVLVVALCAYRPVAATYLYIATLPFIAGFERGATGLRPNEALLLLLLAGAGIGAYVRLVRGEPLALRLRPAVDVPLAAFVLLSTAWPLASLLLLGGDPGTAELVAVLPVCKLAALLVLVRATVVEQSQLLRCVRLVVWPGAAIAALAIMQTLSVAPAVELAALVTPGEPVAELTERGSTTLGSSLATGDYILIALTLVVTCGARGLLGRRERLAAGLVLGAGVLAAGQFSTWIAAVVVGALILARYPRMRRRAVRFLPVAGLAVLVGLPAFASRLAGFGEGFGVPRSWLGRWDNLSEFFIPPLLEDFRFLVGVSPDAVLVAPETWRDVIYIESGYLQLLWIGGVPLLAGFAWLSVAVLRRAGELARRPDALGACASTLQIAWWALIVLSVIDPHLYLRGTGDLLFVLLAVATGVLGDRRARPARSARGHP
jgi:hypothetical protein